MLDLGANFSLSLDEDLLEKINTQISDPVKTWDWKGNVYKYPSYLISKVNLCGLEWKNVTVKGTNRQFHESAAIWSDDPHKVKIKEFKGTIGVPLLEKTNLCLDLDREAIFSCNSLKTLQKKGICPQDMIQIPFSLIKGHIFVLAETDVGQLNLMIDTGCTISTIKSSLNKEFSQKTDRRGLSFITSSYLKFSENNFGEIDFYLLDLDPGFAEIDGVLGMNFLEKYIIYIDYPNKFLYIENPNPCR